MKIRPEDALEYHSSSPAGKLSVTPTKACRTQRDLSLAYTPGVAVPCLEIERDPHCEPEPNAVYKLAGVFGLSPKPLLELAGLTEAKTPGLREEAVRFAARSESV